MKWMTLAGFLALMVAPSASLAAAAPVFAIASSGSSVTFDVKSSLKIHGRFHKWTSTLTFTSPELSTGVFNLEVDANSVDTGDGMKNGVLKSDKFFAVKNNPTITFHSSKISQTGAHTFAVGGVFTLRDVSKPQTLTFTTVGRNGSGHIKGTMTFNRRDYGMNGGIPFVRISDHVDVTLDLKVRRFSGPPLALKS
jgi:polyisoprenoid-binding protein YceI